MSYNPHDAYRESRILSAEPIELIRLLYQAATAAVRDARRHLAAGEILPRAKAISRACEILIELTSSLDHTRGGEISARLAQLYDYMLRRLVAANFQQADAPLAEVLALLSTLSEAWDGVKTQTSEPPLPAESRWAQPVPVETAATYSPQAWSF